MVPLYAARAQDLGTDDFVIIKCGAGRRTAEISPRGPIRRIGLKPTEKVPDLAAVTPIVRDLDRYPFRKQGRKDAETEANSLRQGICLGRPQPLSDLSIADRDLANDGADFPAW
jgi:hypothetical protein